MSEQELDPIQQMNYDGAKLLGREKFQKQSYQVYGDYTYIPIQEDRRNLIQKAFDEIHNIVKPTISKLDKTENISEIQDLLYKKFGQFEGQLNYCIGKAKNVKDSNYCSDVFLNQMNTEGKAYTINILRNY